MTLFRCFLGASADQIYAPFSNWVLVKKVLDEALASYNELVAVMNLVLFEDAMIHICRIRCL